MATKQLFGRVVKVHIESSKYKTDFSGDDLHIEFEVTFDDDEKPNQSIISIYNLSKTSISRIIKDSSVTLQAGYRGDYGVLVQGKVIRISTIREGVDKITTITLLEGKDYSRQKTPKAITFKKGTKADVIIKKLVNILGITLAEFKLPKNVTYKKGYSVTGQIENNLVEVVKDCGAAMYWRRGKMVIRSIKEGNDERFLLQESTGLIGHPESFEEDEVKGYTAKCLLQHRITTASIIEIKSRTANGKYRVKRGKHICNKNEFLTDIQVI